MPLFFVYCSSPFISRVSLRELSAFLCLLFRHRMPVVSGVFFGGIFTARSAPVCSIFPYGLISDSNQRQTLCNPYPTMFYFEIRCKYTMKKLPSPNFSSKKNQKNAFFCIFTQNPAHKLHKLQNCTTVYLPKILIIII